MMTTADTMEMKGVVFDYKVEEMKLLGLGSGYV
jgi:hypothetical protein